MDCTLSGVRRSPHRRRIPGRSFIYVAVAVGMCTLTGCSLFVMGGKMLFGDPVLPSDFKQITGVNLAKDDKTVLILCSTPRYLKDDVSSLEFDLIDGVSRRLKRNEINVVSPDKVLEWIDDNGGRWSDPRELADEFDTDYIIVFRLSDFGFREQSSPSLFRGRATGLITAYEVRKVGEQKETFEVFTREVTSIYPQHYPVSAHETTTNSFSKKYVDRLCDELARNFYDHRALTDI